MVSTSRKCGLRETSIVLRPEAGSTKANKKDLIHRLNPPTGILQILSPLLTDSPPRLPEILGSGVPSSHDALPSSAHPTELLPQSHNCVFARTTEVPYLPRIHLLNITSCFSYWRWDPIECADDGTAKGKGPFSGGEDRRRREAAASWLKKSVYWL